MLSASILKSIFEFQTWIPNLHNINCSFIPEYIKDEFPSNYLDNQFFNYDFALITLGDEIRKNYFKLSQTINPICLPYKKDDLLKDNRKFIIAGWGKFRGNTQTTNLRIAEVKAMDNKKCYKALESKEWDKLLGPKYFSEPDGYCLLGNSKQRMCLFDNGGPAITKDTTDNDRAYLVGIGQ